MQADTERPVMLMKFPLREHRVPNWESNPGTLNSIVLQSAELCGRRQQKNYISANPIEVK